jgi:hypothetical protein
LQMITQRELPVQIRSFSNQRYHREIPEIRNSEFTSELEYTPDEIAQRR